MILGTISAVDSDNGLQLIIDGEDTPTTKKYTYMASYVPTANDRVLIEEISGSYVIMGKVISEVSDSGIARQAASANTADTATTAETAEGLDSSQYGTSSGSLIYNFSQGYDSQIGYYIQSITLAENNTRAYVYKK